MERNVKFLVAGKMTSGELVSKNSKSVQVRIEPCGKVFTRRFDRHNITIAPPGILYPEDLEKLPKWYLSYQKFLESRFNEKNGFTQQKETLDRKEQIAEALLKRFEFLSGLIASKPLARL